MCGTEYVEERYGTKEYTKRKKRQYITGGMILSVSMSMVTVRLGEVSVNHCLLSF